MGKTGRRARVQILDDGTLMLFGVIGDEWDGLDAKSVIQEIRSFGDDVEAIDVLINSPGGFVNDGIAIYHELITHPADISIEIAGVAASMASAIAMAGDNVRVAENGMIMVHDPWNAAVGTAEDLRKAAEMLDKYGDSLVDIYARKTGLDEDRIRDLMSEETWMNAEEALELGFVDEIVEAVDAAAFADLDVSELEQVPATLTALIRQGRRAVAAATRDDAGEDEHPTGGQLLAAAITDRATETGQTEDELREEAATAAGVTAGRLAMVERGEIPSMPVRQLKGLASLEWMPSESEIISAFEPDPNDDASSGGRDTDGDSSMTKTTKKADHSEAVAAERERISSIRSFANRIRDRFPETLGAEALDELVDSHIEDGSSETAFRSAVVDRLADESDSQPPANGPSGVIAGSDERDRLIDGASDWLIMKAGKSSLFKDETLEPGDFRGMSLLDLARETLERSGRSTRGMSKMEIAGAALTRSPQAQGLGTRSDFPILLENVLHKMLQAAYETVPDTWRLFCAEGSVSDFRPHPRLRLGTFGELDDLNEEGEFRQKHFPDGEKESVSAATKGNIVGLNRQAIVNDDVDGFSRLITMLGRAAALSVEVDVYALLALNSGLGPTLGDGDTLFHANHSNIGSGSALSVAGLDADRVLMAQQQDPDENEFLDLRPAVLVLAVGLGGQARVINEAQFDVDAVDAGTDEQNKFMQPNKVVGLFRDIVDTPRISGTRRYLFADPAVAPVIEVVFLDGQGQPVLETEEGFDYDGVRWRVRYDYGVGATDFRGAITNAGA